MLAIGSFQSHDCQGMSRRAFVNAAFTLPFACELTNLRSNASEGAPKARSVLLVWLGGGPSHLDLFDPKPHAPVEYRGPFSSIPTRIPGVRFTELLPRLAARSQHFSLIRSNINYVGGHRPAGSIGLTGSLAPDGGEDSGGKPGRYPPNFGSILARHRPAGKLPGFVSLARGPIGDGVGPVFGYGGGTWGKTYDPFMLSCSEEGIVEIPELKLLDGLTPARLSNRQTVLQEVDRLERNRDLGQFKAWDNFYQRAYALWDPLESTCRHASLSIL